MSMYDVLYGGIQGTSLEEPLAALYEIYSAADEAMVAWKRACGVSCPQGCGSCCEIFEPDVLPLESLYLAAFLMKEKRGYLNGIDFSSRSPGCLFYDPDAPYHCTVYDGRALVCRLFGFTGVHDKNGQVNFRLCRFLPSDAGRTYGEAELLCRFGALPPVMDEIATRIVSLDPEGVAERLPLRTTVLSAARKIMMLSRLDALELSGHIGQGIAS